MRVSDYYEAPYQGVSQAPAQVRLSTQAAEITDWNISVPAGAQLRAPFDFVATFPDLDNDTFAHEFIKKSGVGSFIMTLSREGTATVPRLYTLAGVLVPCTVSPAAQAYLDLGITRPDNQFRMLTVEDFTFILNTQVTVENGSTASTTRPFEAMVWVRQAAYARTYTLTVTPEGGAPVTATLVTPNGKDASDGDDVDTSTIATGLNGGTYPVSATGGANGGSLTGSITTATLGGDFTVTRVADILYIQSPTTNFTVDVEDGQGGTAMLAIKDRVQAFSDLPKRVPVDGFTVRITQQTGAENDDFYVRYRQTAGLGTGVWEESIAPGANLGADGTTLPVGLVYDQGAGTWSLDTLTWEGRTVGDPDLAPDPGYIGKTLQDVVFWKGRLGLLYSEGIRISSATDPLRMYPSTLTQVLADDAVEVVNPLSKQADFRYALPFKKLLVLWGALGQAQVTSGGQPLTPGTAIADPYSYYEFSETARPQASNDRIYFAAPRGLNASAVYEMEAIVQGNNEANEGDDMSVSVPKFIPPNINRLATCPVNYLTIYGRSGDTTITPHLYRYADRERVQNAWSRWTLPQDSTYAGGFFDNTRLYIFVLRDDAIYLIRADTADGVTDAGSSYVTRADFRVTTATPGVVRTYSSSLDRTTVTLPYALHRAPVVMVTAPGGVGGLFVIGDGLLDAPEGTEPDLGHWSRGQRDFTLEGDWRSAPLVIGEPLGENRILLSPIFYRDKTGRPDSTGRMVLKRITFSLSETAYVQVKVTVGGRRPRVSTFEANLWSTPGSDFDQVTLYSGDWSVPIGGLATETRIEIITDSHLPASILGYTWEGEVNPKSTRINSQ